MMTNPWIHDLIHFVVVRTATRAITVELPPTVNVTAVTMRDVRNSTTFEVDWHFEYG